MKAHVEIYETLKKLYSAKDVQYGSLRKGLRIEKLVNSLIKDIVSPLNQNLNIRYGKREFDGEVVLGKGYAILYEIYGGKLSRFRFDSLLDTVRRTYFPRKRNYLLNIARGFSKQDMGRIYELAERTLTTRTKICFMDYETLISLHRFSLNIQADDPKKGLKIMKRLFLGRLFDSDSIISEKLFDDALSFAKDRYYFEIQERYMAYAPVTLEARPEVIYVARELYEKRLHDLEKLLMEALDEVKELRKALNRRNND